MGNYKMCDIFKTVGRRAKLSNIWASGVFSVYRVLFTANCSNSAWGHLVHFRFLTTLYLRNG